MDSILKVKDAEGNWIDIPAIVGPRGNDGPAGPEGKTPVRGVDYWTAADKQEVIDSVLSALDDGDEVSY